MPSLVYIPAAPAALARMFCDAVAALTLPMVAGVAAGGNMGIAGGEGGPENKAPITLLLLDK